MPKARIKFTADFLIEAFRRYRRQHRGRRAGLAVKVLGLLIFVPCAVALLCQGHLFLGIFLAFFSVFMFFAHRVDYWRARRAFRKSPFRDEEVAVELSEAGYHTLSPKHEMTLQWSAFTRVSHFRDGFLLFEGPAVFRWLPLSSLEDPSQAAELEALLRAKIPEHRIVERAAVPPPAT